ncbi:MAG: hypothetical protein HY670_09320 [Chloroflexi bacterium]|nr:hypothetical protein [Chloroflexota bacterium]
MNIARQLYQLQEVDLELADREQRLARLTNQLGDSQAVLNAQVELDAATKHLEDARHQQRSIEWEVDDLSAKIGDIEQRLYGGKIKNPKELTGLQAESEAFKARRSQLEDQILELMDGVEMTTHEISSRTARLQEMKVHWRQQQRQLASEIEQVKGEIVNLKRDRGLLLADLDPHTSELYEEVRRQKGVAVARVEQGICRGCRISLPVTDLQRVKSGSVVQCSSCGRILFLA